MSMTRQEFEKIAKPKIRQWLLDWTKAQTRLESAPPHFFLYTYKWTDKYFSFIYTIDVDETDELIVDRIFNRVCSLVDGDENADYSTIQVRDYGEQWKDPKDTFKSLKKENKPEHNMKKLTWQQWTALGIFAAAVITLVVLHFVQPTVSYAFTEAMTAGGVVVGGIGGYMLKAKNIIKSESAEK